MKQNPDCMRDILLELEEIQDFDKNGSLQVVLSEEILSSKLNQVYSRDDIIYSIKQLTGYELLQAEEKKQLREVSYKIYDITPAGHEFLNNIRNSGAWTEVKKKAQQVGSFAVSILSKIATGVISNKIDELM